MHKDYVKLYHQKHTHHMCAGKTDKSKTQIARERRKERWVTHPTVGIYIYIYIYCETTTFRESPTIDLQPSGRQLA
jgi:hypothetical protein